jgi:putative photosynthetic complex assembly protein 2
VTPILLPLLFALLLWWAGTLAVLLLDHRPVRSHGRSLRLASLGAALALAVLVGIRDLTTPFGAYLGFACALLIWGWHELSFLTGRVTGSRRGACPAGCAGWRHARHAFEAISHHEYALFATLALLLALAWNTANPLGAWTFLLLWTMRISAKLNLFLGVRNPGSELLPAPVQYLASFFGRRAWNPLLPVSLLGIALLLLALGRAAFLATAGSFDATAYGLLAALAALALFEHVCLVLPWPVTRLWDWSVRRSYEN